MQITTYEEKSYCPTTQLRCASQALLPVPPPSEVTRDKEFSMEVPHLWNACSLETCLVPTLLLFRHQDKIHLFTQAFKYGFNELLCIKDGFYAADCKLP